MLCLFSTELLFGEMVCKKETWITVKVLLNQPNSNSFRTATSDCLLMHFAKMGNVLFLNSRFYMKQPSYLLPSDAFVNHHEDVYISQLLASLEEDCSNNRA